MRQLAPETYRTWVMLACGFTAAGYAATLGANVLTSGWVRPGVRWSEAVTLGAALLGWVAARRGRVDSAAVLVIALLWVQVHLGIFLTAEIFRPGAFVFPGLVIGGGMLLGRTAGWGIALTASTSGFVAASLGWSIGYRQAEVVLPPWQDSRQVVFAVVMAASLVAIAAILSAALQAFERAVEEARESSARLERLVADAPDGILTLDAAGRIVDVNPRAMSIFERGTRTLVGEDFATLFQGEWAADVTEWLARGAGDMLRLRTPSRVLEATGRQLVGTEVGSETQVFLRDVSDRETASELAAELSRVIRETPAEVLFFRAVDGQVVLTSRGLRDNLGYTGADLFGRRIEEVSPGFAEVGRQELLRRLEATPGDTARLAGVHRRVDGSMYPIDGEYALGELAGDRVVIGFVTDMTSEEAARRDQLELQRQLQHAQKMEAVGHLAGGVAHDFNNLLTVVGGCAEVLREDVPPSLHDLVDEISGAQERGQELIRRLLAFARRDIAQPRVLHLEQLVSNSLLLLRRLVGEKVRIEAEVVGEVPPTRVDPGQVEQVLMNLVANSRDALPDGGSVTLRTSATADGSRVRLEVIDDGVGMPSDVQDRIFEPFFTTKSVGAGTGLGLATVQAIVRHGGGSVSVESRLSEGTRFILEWPSAPGQVVDAPEGEEAAVEAGAMRLLYVEDFPETRTLVGRLLRRAGHTVHMAESGEAALALPLETLTSVDMVVTDVVMPGVSGIAMAEELRRRGIDVPVLFVSGYLDEEIHGTVPDDGRHDLLLKPFTGRELNARIAALTVRAQEAHGANLGSDPGFP